MICIFLYAIETEILIKYLCSFLKFLILLQIGKLK